MKGAVSLALLCLFVCSVASTGSHNSHVSLSRAASIRQCELQCDGPNIDGNSSWIIEIEFNLYLIYNAETNYVAIFHKQLGLSFVILGGGIVGIVNHKTGGSLIINVKINVALYVKGSGALDGDISVAIDAAFKIVADNKDKVSGNVDVNSGFYFKLTVIFNIEVELKSRTELRLALVAEFGALITAVGKAVRDGLVSRVNGVIRAILYVFIVQDSVRVKLIIQLSQLIVFLVDGSVEITVELLTELRRSLSASAEEANKLINSLLKAVAGRANGLFKSIGEALQNLGKKTGKGIASVIQSLFSVVNSTVKGIVTLVLQIDLSWSFEIRNSDVDNERVAVNYDAETNVLVFVNYQTKLLLAYNGKNTYYAIFNIETGACLLIKYERSGLIIKKVTGGGIVLDRNAKLAKVFASGIANSYAQIQKVFNDNKVPSKPQFDVVNILAGKGLGDCDSKVHAAFKSDFAAVLSFQSKTQFDYIYLIFGTLNVEAFSSSFVNFIQVIFEHNGGKYDKFLLSLVANAIFESFQRQFVNGLLGGLVKALTNILATIGGIVSNIFNAIVTPLAKLLRLDTNFDSKIKLDFSFDASVDIQIKSSVRAVGPKAT